MLILSYAWRNWRMMAALCLLSCFWTRSAVAFVALPLMCVVFDLLVYYLRFFWFIYRQPVRLVMWLARIVWHFVSLPFRTTVHHAPALLLVEGNICALKTTTLGVAARTCTGKRIVVINEGVPAAALAQFHATHDGTELQMTMGQLRIDAFARSAAALAAGDMRVYVHERSLVGCRVFAYANYVCGTLPRAALDQYLELVGRELAPRLLDSPSTTTVLYILEPVRACRQRLDARTGADQAATPQYLMCLAYMYALVLRHLIAQNVAVRLLAPAFAYLPPAVPSAECECVQFFDRPVKAGTLNAVQKRVAAAKGGSSSNGNGGEPTGEVRMAAFGGKLRLDDVERARLNELSDEMQMSRAPLDIYESAWTRDLVDDIVESSGVTLRIVA